MKISMCVIFHHLGVDRARWATLGLAAISITCGWATVLEKTFPFACPLSGLGSPKEPGPEHLRLVRHPSLHSVVLPCGLSSMMASGSCASSTGCLSQERGKWKAAAFYNPVSQATLRPVHHMVFLEALETPAHVPGQGM